MLLGSCASARPGAGLNAPSMPLVVGECAEVCAEQCTQER